MKKVIIAGLLALGLVGVTASARGITIVEGDYYKVRNITEVSNTYVDADLTKERVTSSALSSV